MSFLAFSIIAFALIGLIIGSFLNVVILRRGARSVGGRSGCLSCGAPLYWYDLIPVISWVTLRGRCRACGSRVSLQYPVVEAASALLFVAIGLADLSIPLKIIALLIAALLILITAYDIRHTIIPDEWVYAFAILAFISSSTFALEQSGTSGILMLLIAGPATALPLFALWLVSRGKWMGFGDVKLALGIGWLLGISAGLAAIFLAFVIGALISVVILLPLRYISTRIGITRLSGSARGFTMKSEVPFGPFLVASCILLWLMMIYGIPVLLLSYA